MLCALRNTTHTLNKASLQSEALRFFVLAMPISTTLAERN